MLMLGSRTPSAMFAASPLQHESTGPQPTHRPNATRSRKANVLSVPPCLSCGTASSNAVSHNGSSPWAVISPNVPTGSQPRCPAVDPAAPWPSSGSIRHCTLLCFTWRAWQSVPKRPQEINLAGLAYAKARPALPRSPPGAGMPPRFSSLTPRPVDDVRGWDTAERRCYPWLLTDFR